MKQTGKRVAVGVLAAFLVYLALLALTALLIVRGTVGEGSVPVCIWVFSALAVFAGAKAASWRAAEPVLPIAVCAAAFWGLVLLFGFLANDGLEPARAAALVPAVFAGALTAYLTRGGKKRGKRKRRSRK